MRVLVTGASGLVGSRTVVRLRARHEVHGTYRRNRPDFIGHPAERLHALDVTDPAALKALFDRLDPEAVVHAAAWTDVDGCEANPAKARADNVAPTRHLAKLCAARGASMVLYSTDYVFDGRHPPYTEDAAPSPLSVYAATKAQAEAAVAPLEAGLIVRSSVNYGRHFGHLKQNFVAWLIGELKAGRPVRIVRDQCSQPTLAESLAQVVDTALERKLSGVLHAVPAQCLARDEFSRQVARRFGLDEGLITPVSTADLKQRAPRPARPCLDTAQSAHRLAGPPWTLEDSLALLTKQLHEGPQLKPWW